MDRPRFRDGEVKAPKASSPPPAPAVAASFLACRLSRCFSLSARSCWALALAACVVWEGGRCGAARGVH